MRTGFLPSRHGFPFDCSFEYPGELFGLGAPVLPSFGLCGGMAWAALDRYLADRPVPRDLARPKRSSPLYLELVRRQTNALAEVGWSELRRLQRLPDRGRPGRPGLTERTRGEWQRVKRSLDGGMPILLCLIRASGPWANPTLNHLVLAYHYEVDRRSRRATIWVYDPARPGNDGIRVLFRTRGRGSLEARFAVQDVVRGFFAVPYDRVAPPRLRLERPDEPAAEAARTMVGPASGVVELGGHLHVVGRDGHGMLMDLQRLVGGRWTDEEPSRGRHGAVPVDGAPVPVMAGGLRILARGNLGDLIECRRHLFVGWRARSLTGAPGIGPDFRIDTDPVVVAGPGPRLSVFGRKGGRLIHYAWRRWRGWSAADLSRSIKRLRSTAIQGDVAACTGTGGSQHVFVRDASDDLLHLHRRAAGWWAAENVTQRLGGSDRVRPRGAVVPVTGKGGRNVDVLARNRAGELLLFRWRPGGAWQARLMADAPAFAEADPDGQPNFTAVRAADGTVHVLARNATGGLLHAWCSPDLEAWSEELTATRPATAAVPVVDCVPQIARGPDRSLIAFARRGNDLVHFRWSPEGDWTAENLSAERWPDPDAAVAGEPVIVPGRRGHLHVIGQDEDGRMLHVKVIAPTPARRILVDLRTALRYLAGGVADAVTAPFWLAAGAYNAVAARVHDAIRYRAVRAGGRRWDLTPPPDPVPEGAAFGPYLFDQPPGAHPAEPVPPAGADGTPAVTGEAHDPTPVRREGVDLVPASAAPGEPHPDPWKQAPDVKPLARRPPGPKGT